jgi:hypothetical protein
LSGHGGVDTLATRHSARNHRAADEAAPLRPLWDTWSTAPCTDHLTWSSPGNSPSCHSPWPHVPRAGEDVVAWFEAGPRAPARWCRSPRPKVEPRDSGWAMDTLLTAYRTIDMLTFPQRTLECSC